MAQKVTLYKPDKPEQFLNVTNTSVKDGVLTFYWNGNQSNKKITASVPFVLEEDIA